MRNWPQRLLPHFPDSGALPPARLPHVCFQPELLAQGDFVYRLFVIIAAAAICFMAAYGVREIAVHAPGTSPAPAEAPSGPAERVVTLVPSLTETVAALGFTSKLAAVSDFCEYPPAVKDLPRAGGMTPNIEAIAGLEPDVVFLNEFHTAEAARMEALNLNPLIVPQKTLDGVLQSFVTVGEACGDRARGLALREAVTQELNAIRAAVDGLERPRVLLVVGRDPSETTIREVYLAEPGGFLEELLMAAGGTPAYQEGFSAAPLLTAEGVLSIQPEVIIELHPRALPAAYDPVAAWSQVPGLQAPDAGKVYALEGQRLLIPGPRLGETARLIATLLHPEALEDAA